MHTERGPICAMQNLVALLNYDVLNQRIGVVESCIELLAVSKPRMDKQCSNFYAKILSFDALQKRVWCGWILRYYVPKQ